jgi:hypothetical protein
VAADLFITHLQQVGELAHLKGIARTNAYVVASRFQLSNDWPKERHVWRIV